MPQRRVLRDAGKRVGQGAVAARASTAIGLSGPGGGTHGVDVVHAWMVDWSVPVGGSIGRSVGGSISRLVDQSVGRSVGWSVGRLVGQYGGQSVGWLVSRVVG